MPRVHIYDTYTRLENNELTQKLICNGNQKIHEKRGEVAWANPEWKLCHDRYRWYMSWGCMGCLLRRAIITDSNTHITIDSNHLNLWQWITRCNIWRRVQISFDLTRTVAHIIARCYTMTWLKQHIGCDTTSIMWMRLLSSKIDVITRSCEHKSLCT